MNNAVAWGQSPSRWCSFAAGGCYDMGTPDRLMIFAVKAVGSVAFYALFFGLLQLYQNNYFGHSYDTPVWIKGN
jgi:hypothetical protein